MNMKLSRIRQIFPNFNRVAIEEADFWRASKKSKIIVKELPLIVDGYYQIKRGRHYILINNRLSRFKWLHTALHEFSHYLFDIPTLADKNALFRESCGNMEDPRERFADAFALIGMLPMPDLEKICRQDLSEDPWLANIVQARIVVRADYRL